MYKRILVTGSSGVLGSALKEIGHEYPQCQLVFTTRKECDLRDLAASLEFARKIGPDAILHLAAVSGGVALSMKYPATVLRDNVLMSINMLEIARILKTGKLVMTLSSGMYSEDVPLPIKEEYIHRGPAHGSNYSYAYAKRLIEPAIRAYREEFGIGAVGVVPNGIFGENDNFDMETASMPAALIRRFYELRDGGGAIAVWGDGAPLRELTYSKDMARAVMWCLFHYDSPEILNIGTTEEYSVREIAFMIADELGIDRNRIAFDAAKPNGVLRKSTDNSKFVRLSRFQYTSLRVGLSNTINWLKANYEAAVQKSYNPARPAL